MVKNGPAEPIAAPDPARAGRVSLMSGEKKEERNA